MSEYFAGGQSLREKRKLNGVLHIWFGKRAAVIIFREIISQHASAVLIFMAMNTEVFPV